MTRRVQIAWYTFCMYLVQSTEVLVSNNVNSFGFIIFIMSSSLRVLSFLFSGLFLIQTLILSDVFKVLRGEFWDDEIIDVVLDLILGTGASSFLTLWLKSVLPLADFLRGLLPFSLFWQFLYLLIFSAEADRLPFLLRAPVLEPLVEPAVALLSLIDCWGLGIAGSVSLPFCLLKLRRKNVARLKYMLLGGVGSAGASLFSLDLFSGGRSITN